MNILIIGACSKTGKKLIAHGLRKGHNVTAIVDKPEALQLFDDNLRVVCSNTLNQEDIASVLGKQHVVINVVGGVKFRIIKKPKNVPAMPMDDILPTMSNQSAVRRLLVINTRLIGRSKIDRTHNEKVKNSGLDWTIVNPAILIDKPKTGCYKVGVHLPRKPFARVSHADVADYIINNIENKALVGKIISIRY